MKCPYCCSDAGLETIWNPGGEAKFCRSCKRNVAIPLVDHCDEETARKAVKKWGRRFLKEVSSWGDYEKSND